MKRGISSFFSIAVIVGILTGSAFANTYGNIEIDGDLSDWSINDRINLPDNLPPALANGDAIYAKFVTQPEPAYVFAIDSKDTQISADTTIWLNTDNDPNSGYQIWGAYGGAEFFVNIYSDNQPYLYDGDPFGEFVGGPLESAYSADGKIIEFVIPSSMIENPDSGLGVFADINDQVFLPSDYAAGELKVLNNPPVLPPREDFSKKVGIVYSQTTKEHFYDVNMPIQKAYNQLFMTMQHQCMMAGIPFELLNEDDLTDVSRIKDYDALIFPYFAFVPQDKFEVIHQTLFDAVYHYGIGLITAGDFMTNYEDGSAIEGDSYRNMEQLFGIDRVDGEGPVAITLNANDVTHPAMEDYSMGETIINYEFNHWYSYFEPVSNGVETQPVSVLATQSVTGDNAGTYDAVMAIETGARNVHFSSIEFMADTNMLWSALEWVVYGDKRPVSLKLGRFNNLFISRTDMDQSQEIDEVADNDGALYDIIKEWKKRYNFVGSYFINIGNNPPDQQTDWSYSEPLYKKYIALGNEIGTHSYTHPHNTNILSSDEIRFEFDDSMNIIAEHLNPTWRNQNIRGGAVPGAPESLDTANEILQYLDYMTGGYSGVGAGYPGAFGYLTPNSTKVYFSPNMVFDFTLIEFGVPVWDESSGQWVPQPLSADEAQQYWQDEYHTLMKHASQPIIHWPWHDYGPTTGVTVQGIYSESMFTNVVKSSYEDRGEFLTSADAAQRIATFKDSRVTISQNDENTVIVNVNSSNAGKFAVDIDRLNGKVIKSVDNWYAYDNDSIFLDQDGGEFTVNLGTATDAITHITSLPMRAELISLEGDGNNLYFTFKGEGNVVVSLANDKNNYQISGADKVRKFKHKKGDKKARRHKRSSNTVILKFENFGIHTVSIKGI